MFDCWSCRLYLNPQCSWAYQVHLTPLVWSIWFPVLLVVPFSVCVSFWKCSLPHTYTCTKELWVSCAKDCFLVPLHLGNCIIASLNCHLHLMYSTKPNSQVYNKCQFLWVRSHKHIQAYNKVQLLCAGTKSWTQTSSYTLAFDQFLLWFQLGGVTFFLSFWHTIQKYNIEVFLQSW